MNRKPSLREFILKYFHFYLLSYRVDKTRFSSSGAARDSYVHLDVSPTFQFVLKKFFNVWYAILIYITLDVFVVNVFPCHVIHDEEIKVWTGKLVAATELESVYFLGVKAMPFNIYPPLPPPTPSSHGKLYFWWGSLRWHYWSMEYSWAQGYGEKTLTWPFRSGGGTGPVVIGSVEFK